MLIDCDRCEMRGIACPDCVVTALLGPDQPQPDLDPAEQRALRVLADARLVAPLQLRPVGRAGGPQRPGRVA